MNRNRKKKLATLIKVLFAHIFIIFLLDLNISSIISNKPKNINQIDNAKFLNLKSMSMEEIENKRKIIEEEKKRLERLRKKKLAEEKRKKKIAEEKRKKKIAEEKKKKLAEEKRRKTLEKLKKDEESELANYELEKIEKELLALERNEELIKQQMLRNAQLTDAEEKYILTIKSKIENNWLIPHDTKYDKICTVIVNQIPSGKVTDVKVHGCKADILYIDSLINAVWRSSPLPVAPDIEVFQENIVLQFVGPNK
ncbi:MAG: cell envelope integrity protein TolA [Gammaproteobacteria bacterium]